jgi:hypothetical protein
MAEEGLTGMGGRGLIASGRFDKFREPKFGG